MLWFVIIFLWLYVHFRWTKDKLKPYNGKYRDIVCFLLFVPLPFIIFISTMLLLGGWESLARGFLAGVLGALAVFLIMFVFGFLQSCVDDKDKVTIAEVARNALAIAYCLALFGAYGSFHFLWEGLLGWKSNSLFSILATSIVGGTFIYILIMTRIFHRFGDYVEMFIKWESPAIYDKIKEDEKEKWFT